ncbi:hypothetical protein BN938_1201 [Mucinivorans hirudinis]|uniref:Hemerythrin-like domain-containing protein n=1 Tax=Mucinivorans hirudinis TaxID=1433126 RepID=A0A060R7N3_9BACT|nr:hypothetical protein BN938_1201 [Mucinivorans hirudinis]
MDSNKYMLFSGKTKMADVILRDCRIVTLLPRFDVRLGFAEKTLSQVCAKYGINEHFFLLACNIHSFDGYFPDREELAEIDIESMLQYLKRSHDYYINTRIVSIEQRLAKMVDSCTGYHYKIISGFFSEYKQEVLKHFQHEEVEVFPNIRALIRGERVDFHIAQYEENHSNIDDKLNDLKNIIIKYLPEDCSTQERNDILLDIFMFEEDLTKHTRIENKVLIPYVRQIERSYEKK